MEVANIWNQFHLHRSSIGLLALLLLMLMPLAAEAQINFEHHDNKRVHFGILMGYNTTRFSIDHSEAFILHDSIKVVESPNSPGFNLGIVSNLKIGRNLDLRFIPTLVFAEKDLRYVEVSGSGDFVRQNTIESIYLSFPVGVKYKSDRFYDNFRFYVLSGLKLDLDLASNSKKRKANDIIKLGVLDVGVEVGFGFEFYFPLFIFSPEIKLSQGVNNVHVPTENYQYSDVIDNLRSRTLTISLQFEG